MNIDDQVRLIKKYPKFQQTWIVSFDPVLKDLIRYLGIDLAGSNFYSGENIPHPAYKHSVYLALLISSHPSLDKLFSKIRRRSGIRKTYKYPFNDDRKLSFLKQQLNSLPYVMLQGEMKGFFDRNDHNIPQDPWKDAIEIRILSGILPVPPPDKGFDIINGAPYFIGIDYFKGWNPEKTSKEADVEFWKMGRRASEVLGRYPAIIIKKKLTSVDELVQYVKSYKKYLFEVTKALPDDKIRADVDLTKLAIGIWGFIYKDKDKKWFDDWMDEKYETDKKYFGKKYSQKNPLTHINILDLKSEALEHIKHIYPLK